MMYVYFFINDKTSTQLHYKDIIILNPFSFI